MFLVADELGDEEGEGFLVVDVGVAFLKGGAAPVLAFWGDLCPHEFSALAVKEAGEDASGGAGLGFGAAFDLLQDALVGVDIPDWFVDADCGDGV